MMKQDRALGNQVVATYGFRDSLGTFTGVPGQFVGSNQVALDTGNMGRSSFQPGYELTIGYKFSDGFKISLSYLQLMEQYYNAGASGPGNVYSPGAANANTFLYSGVYNFTPYFAGPQIKTFDDQFSNQFDTFPITGRLYGIWNGPIYETDYSKTYGLAGGRFAWFFERFTWNTVSTDSSGNSSNLDSATYTNTLSQRMYGAFIGCGNELYIGKNFAFTFEATGSILMDVALERPKYERDDGFTESKNSRDDYAIVPNFNFKPSLFWYPYKGVEMKLSYVAELYFNTIQMNNPIGFNFGDIDPGYTHRVLRLVQGVQIGVGISF
jgi:hypothetical protein